MPGKSQREERCGTGSCWVWHFLKARILNLFFSQPSPFCFILSLFFISGTLALLGLYIKGDHMPDLDSMKYWNAYIGKLDDKDFCFKHQKLQNVSDSNCNISTNNHDVWCSSLKKNVLYGTVRVKLNFTLHRNTIDEGIFQGYHSSFTGADIGAQIKENLNYTRIDACIYLDVWIQLHNINTSTFCSNDVCIVPGCMQVAAPTNAIPTRMPHVHKNFTFAAQVLESKDRPVSCSCDSPNSLKYAEMNIIHSGKDCKYTNSSIVTLNLSSKRVAKGYGVINVELSDVNKRKASQHMYIAAFAIVLMGLAFVIGIIFSPSTIPKTSLA